MNQRDQKGRNRELVFSLLRSCSGISQAEIAERTKLQPSTTSNLVRALKERGVVAAVGKRDSGPQGGKKADVLALRSEYGHFGGIYIKEDEIIFGLVDFGGTIVERRRVSVSSQGDEAILDAIVDEINRNAQRYPAYHGTGIAVSSVVSLDGDITESLDFSRAIPEIISEIRSRAAELPLVVDNDANCAADWDLFVNREAFRNLVHLQVQTSPITVGAGIVIDGEVFRGTTGAAGELSLPGIDNGEGSLATGIEMIARFVGTLLDTQAVFVAGELDERTVKELSLRAAAVEQGLGRAFRVLDNADLPVLGASLQAMRLHMSQILWE